MDFAKVVWEENTPKSYFFGDFYFSSESGVEESRYNFLDHNLLESKFSSLNPNQKFCICETGFGSGLNFILTMNLWQKVAPVNTYLEFVSFEKYPMTLNDISRVLKSFNNLEGCQELLNQYTLEEGLNIFNFKGITLKLIIDDINNIDKYTFSKVDSWFLDGFAPAKNISMWTDSFFEKMHLYSNFKSSFATFTASSYVRKQLQKNGFEIKKDKGFGKKREMMYGYLKS
ncbi:MULTISPECIES: tRNA (5-methylaminomethyl-2-thiouridine)(34)-methyltransferase MnmD [unclassified Francisella]|uniref:tRNA (5-methylaminomethyl-2-thiouridine)(34)-methyltransferase MnmD n=1 Tax=unclassified Francisella TaxID=2610885 RepID=UPI002E3632E0|nr:MULTISPECIES: tRNA (5-methylaminomethyl-2-thiouridine)(34)-methyltransferase MnmD [unclassified Francisella]MED7818366.1 tRNA (5-methylaminomethyl-2-thiouridine)(34)-methyltransferase MnmD [Francisella sp. 19S2-4]MED7829202.1 tRNA (5-methylaminomethyl-2-thiouridine)(34)-methyltransferase MnmD [Francisella sp. 19S2-10]